MERTTNVRYPEIDLLRTAAILGMVIYHTAFMEWYLYGRNIDVLNGAWWLLARTTSNTFLLLVGVSFVLASQKYTVISDIWKRAVHRAITVLCAAALVSIATYSIEPRTAIIFGILHCIGVSMLLLPLFYRLREWNILLGACVLLISFQWYLTPVDTWLLIPFGFVPYRFTTLDYFALLPWFGVVLIGAGIGSFLFERLHIQPLLSNERWKGVTFFGRHALWVYLIHPVVIYFALQFLHTSV